MKTITPKLSAFKVLEEQNTLLKSTIRLLNNRMFLFPVIFTAIFSYGFFLTHLSIGLDDLSYDRYYFGELFAQGRITGTLIMHLLNLDQSIYHAWTIDLLGISLFVFSAILFSAFLMTVQKDTSSITPYTLFTCLFISYPISSELFGFLGTTIAIGGGFICIILALYFIRQASQYKGKVKYKYNFQAIGLLLLVSSWYESVLPVYIAAVFAIFLLEYYSDVSLFPKWYSFIARGMYYAIPLAIAVILEAVISNSLIMILPIQHSNNADNFIAYTQSGEILPIIQRLIIRFIRDYFIMGLWYLPITILVSAIFISLFLCINDCRKFKSVMPIFFYGGMLFSLGILSIIQGFSSPYRTAQVCNFFVAMIAFLLVGKSKGTLRRILIVILFVVVFWQANDISKWFTYDYLRSEEERVVAQEIGHYIKSNFDTNKPVVFVGDYTLSGRLLDAVMILSDDRFLHLINKIYPLGNYSPSEKYWVRIQKFNIYSYLSWGDQAFSEVNTELLKFFSYYGYDFVQGTEQMQREAMQFAKDLPGWPLHGSVVDMGNYLIVNLGPDT